VILKPYQQTVIDDLSRFLELLDKDKPVSRSFAKFWSDKKEGLDQLMPGYQDTLPGVPNVCLKVPTGGGKTFIAACAIKPIFSYLPSATKAVVWLVPSDSILEQTKTNLQNTAHDYRQRIDVDFGNNVAVYEKSELLMGTRFNPTAVREQLSIFILSYDSFRTSKKDGRKAYQQNGQLAEFPLHLPNAAPLEDTDETALIQVIRSLNPVVIVDESHHATSTLSREMLSNFNPAFVLELTATPKSTSNIISYVDANVLKAAKMVKLPVIVYNRRTKEDVIIQAIDTRDKLEKLAKAEQTKTGRYIRPIVLFQAEPRTGDEASTFDKIKENLIKLDIPASHIAIKTADNKNDLRGVNLLSEDCPIRYIITVNALKEGWDCPFAYILATIANRSSQVDVEQILGRVLRLPYTKRNNSEFLNISYVYTSSNAFQNTLDRVIAGLQSAGFTDKEFRAPDLPEKQDDPPAPVQQLEIPTTPAAPEPELESDTDFDVSTVKHALEQRNEGQTQADEIDIPGAMEQLQEYNETVKPDEMPEVTVPPEVRSKMKSFKITAAFADEVDGLRLPQFAIPMTDITMFDNEPKLLTAEDLYKGFSLRGKNAEIDFTSIDAEIARVDTDAAGSVPKAWKLTLWGNPLYREFFDSLSPEKKIARCKDTIISLLTKDDGLSQSGLAEYIERVVAGLTQEQLEDLQQSPYNYFPKIKRKIEALRAEHTEAIFNLWMEQGKITCEPKYAFPKTISPSRYTTSLPRTLYSAEEEMNGLERDVAWELANLPNIKWWHRNISRSGFAINGYIVDGSANAYPDIIAMTTSGKILVIEPKGDYLDGENSRRKVEIGRFWQDLAGRQYRYYMVYREKDLRVKGAVRFERFLEIVREL